MGETFVSRSYDPCPREIRGSTPSPTLTDGTDHADGCGGMEHVNCRRWEIPWSVPQPWVQTIWKSSTA